MNPQPRRVLKSLRFPMKKLMRMYVHSRTLKTVTSVILCRDPSLLTWTLFWLRAAPTLLTGLMCKLADSTTILPAQTVMSKVLCTRGV